MKFSVAIPEFLKILQKTLPAIPPKSTLPVLEHLHFSLSDGRLQIIATDQDITVMSSIEVDSEEGGEILVPARRLNEIIKELKDDGKIKFESKDDTFEIKLLTPNGKYVMKGLSPLEYLDIPELFHTKPELGSVETDGSTEEERAYFNKNDLVRLASKTSFAVTTDEFRPAMTGVLFQFRETYVNAVATDSYRLALAVSRSEKISYPKEMDIIIPGHAVDILKRIDDDATVSFIKSNDSITHARFDYGNTVFITRLIDEKFPPYESVLPKNNPLFAYINKQEILSALRRVSIFTSSISKQIKFTFEPGSLHIYGRDEEIGTDGDETIPCEFNGEKLEIGFNYRFLEEAISVIDVEDNEKMQIMMTFSEPNRPVLVKPRADTEDLLMLIMPVRLS